MIRKLTWLLLPALVAGSLMLAPMSATPPLSANLAVNSLVTSGYAGDFAAALLPNAVEAYERAIAFAQPPQDRDRISRFAFAIALSLGASVLALLFTLGACMVSRPAVHDDERDDDDYH